MKFDVRGQAGEFFEPVRRLDPLVYELRKRRYDRGVSQSELARRMGYSLKALQSAEAGVTHPSYPMLFDWAQALGLRLALEEAP